MPNLINQSFFVRDIMIPNLSHTADLDRLTSFINKYEPKCLLDILGYPLYKVFGTESSQRMTDLKNGAEFTDGLGETRKWQGLIHDTDISLIANYIYFYYQQYLAQHTTGVGTSVQNQEGGQAISPASKMADAWNFFSDEVKQMSYFLWMKKDVDGNRIYPEFSYHQYCETRRITRRIDSIFSF